MRSRTVYIGSSDIAALIIAGPEAPMKGIRTGISAGYLHFLEDGDYKATLIERTAEETSDIGRDYVLFNSYENWVRFYDDEACTLKIYADRINIYVHIYVPKGKEHACIIEAVRD